MNCRDAEQKITESLLNALSPADREALDAHLAGCGPCRAEAIAAETLWLDLGDMDAQDDRAGQIPGAAMIARFHRGLAAHEAEAVAQRPVWRAILFPTAPAAQALYAAALVLVGLLLGVSLNGRGVDRGEIDALRAEVDATNRAVAVSLLGHQSASERLRAVGYTRQVEPDAQIIDALLASAREDPSVSVRLAAVEALGAWSDHASVRSELFRALTAEESPMVQMTALEVIAGRGGITGEELEALLASDDLREPVRQRLTTIRNAEGSRP